ncbi:carbohydrate ABC transporter permease [Dictyobacter formicarum]|uniref:ABC transporter n=1 Tax=Dictyobacter formicarum TaxID=2778368 RepID=A0ABQ3VTZ2_9CHLR|nr:sugar ABC transporter permease [Dictyobacter formicarum]GHO88576.1 ABC transporter [Dictyobacter formicarum]
MDALTPPQMTEAPDKIRQKTGTRRRRWSRYSSQTFYLFISPWIIGALALTLIPLLYALVVSFTNFDGISTHWHFIGLANYQELIQNSTTWYSLSRTLLYCVITVPVSVAGGLGLAILLNQRLIAVGFFRTIFYLPSVVPVVASAIMWKLIFDRDAGALNAILEPFGAPAFTWLMDPYVFYVLVILTLWGLGGGMIISLAGLQGIPNELREAASIDGANAWQAFRNVTLPLLSPVLFFEVITGMIAALQTFIQPLLLAETNGTTTAGSVPVSNYLYMVNVYDQFFDNQRFGYGSAMLWILFIVILAITLLMFRSSAFWVYYEVDRDE